MKVKKTIKIPTDFGAKHCTPCSLKADGCTLIECCTTEMGTSGALFLKEHTLIMVLKGCMVFRHGQHTDIVHGQEMVFLRKSAFIHYEEYRASEPGDNSDLLIFSFTDELLKEFITRQHVSIPPATKDGNNHTVSPMNECLTAFIHSLRPFFGNGVTVNPGWLKLKIMEVLYNLSECNKELFGQILQARQAVRADIRQVMEQYYTSPVTLPELAALSERSLSSFKRDFHRIYNMPPAQWLRERKLERAKNLLQNTAMTISDVCYSLGFENLSHFSRIFKEYHGISPSVLLKQRPSPNRTK